MKTPFTFDHMWKILPLLVCDSPTVAKVYMYASQGDLGINHDMILMDSLLRALFCKFETQEERDVTNNYRQMNAETEDGAQYLVRAYKIPKTFKPQKRCATKLRTDWAKSAARYNLDEDYPFDDQFQVLKTHKCAWAGWKCAKQTELETLPPAEVDDFTPTEDSVQFWMPEITDPDDRSHLPLIHKRGADERMDLRACQVLKVEDVTENNQRFAVYYFNWALFLNLLEDRRMVRRMTTQYNINHQECGLSPTQKAKLVEEVWCRNVRDVRLRAIRHALNSGGFGADGLDADLQAQSRREFLAREDDDDASHMHYACQARGVRDLLCTDVEPNQNYRVHQVVEPYAWFNGRRFDHGSTSTLILINDPQQEPVSLSCGIKHSISARACLGDQDADRVYNESNRSEPLNHHVDSEIYYRHYLSLVTQGFFQGSPWDLSARQRENIARCAGRDEQETERLRRNKTQHYRKKIFLKKWIHDFPPACRARFLLPVSKHAGHQPQLDVEQLMSASRSVARTQSTTLDLNGSANFDSDSDSDSDSENAHADVAGQSEHVYNDSQHAALAQDSHDPMDMDDPAQDAEQGDDQGWMSSRANKGKRKASFLCLDEEEEEEEEEETAGASHKKRRKNNRKQNVSKYFEESAAHSGSGEDSGSDDSDADENGNLDGFVVSDASGDDDFGSVLTATHALNQRDAAEQNLGW